MHDGPHPGRTLADSASATNYSPTKAWSNLGQNSELEAYAHLQRERTLFLPNLAVYHGPYVYTWFAGLCMMCFSYTVCRHGWRRIVRRSRCCIYDVLSLPRGLWPQSMYLSRVMNQHEHWLCDVYPCVERTCSHEERHVYT